MSETDAHEHWPGEYWPGEWIAREEISPNSWNPNTMTDDELEQLKNSIKDNGWTNPIVVHAEDGYIIDGEHRWQVAAELPDDPDLTPEGVPSDHVPVYGIDVSEQQAKLATVQHNRARGNIRVDRLRDYLEDLRSRGVLSDVHDRIGMQENEVSEILGEVTAGVGDTDSPIADSDSTSESPIPELHEDRTVALRTGEDERLDTEILENIETVTRVLGPSEFETVTKALGRDMRAQSLVNICRYIDDHDIDMQEVMG